MHSCTVYVQHVCGQLSFFRLICNCGSREVQIFCVWWPIRPIQCTQRFCFCFIPFNSWVGMGRSWKIQIVEMRKCAWKFPSSGCRLPLDEITYSETLTLCASAKQWLVAEVLLAQMPLEAFPERLADFHRNHLNSNDGHVFQSRTCHFFRCFLI